MENGNSPTYYDGAISTTLTQTFTAAISNGVTTLNVNGTTKTYATPLVLALSATDGDHYVIQPGSTSFDVYLGSKSDFLGLSTDPFGHLYGNGTYLGVAGFVGTSVSYDFLGTGTPVTDGVTKYTVNRSGVPYLLNFAVFYPKSVESAPAIGIDYTESNRVNNYPIEYEYQENTETQTLPQINLETLAATNYWNGPQWTIGSIEFDYNYSMYGKDYTKFRFDDLYVNSYVLYPHTRYSLADLVAVMDIPVGTSQLVFDTGDYSGREIAVNTGFGQDGWVVHTGHYVPSNFVAIVSSTSPYPIPMIDIDYGWKAYYTVSSGLVDIYTTNGVKISTSTLADTYVQFTKSTYIKGNGGYYYGTTTGGVVERLGSGHVWEAPYINSENHPYLNATAISRGVVTDVKYLDSTKGVSIKPSNISDVVWNNNYENGNIQLLFRADQIDNAYHNDFEVSGNSVSVDYTDSRFYVTLNGGEPVDIGTWRSIVLDIDLENGDLYAIPVRTFNSFTNVQMDNASLFIGNMTDYATTNTIEWKPTPNSLTFSVYNTSVFMNTYGVVMADPSLTITDYFTDLNDFYRLELTNFSIYGDSMTINGKIGEVTGNRITFGDESLIIKKLYITYADGNVYLSDGSTNIDLGEMTTSHIIFGGAWYFKTFLQKGYTAQKQVYTWDWQNFILDNTEFCVIYIGLVLAGLVVARRFCTFTVMDYVVMGISLIIALGVQVIA